MNKKINIKRLIATILWVIVGCGVVVLLVGAINKKKTQPCKGVEIDIHGVNEHYFLDKKDIEAVISPGVPAIGTPIDEFDLRKLEETLKKNVWVKDARLYFDNNATLNVSVDEREPIARIFTITGSSFYIDSNTVRLPLSEKLTIRLPVFTNFPSGSIVLGKSDSVLLQQVKDMSLYIARDSFWTAQVSQVNITADGEFDLIPTVGNHIVHMGDGNNIDKKFERLFLFYKKILSRSGFDRYSEINVQYDKQVVGVRRGTVSKIDYVQAQRNIQQMMESARQMQPDTIAMSAVRPMNPEVVSDSSLSLIEGDSTERAPARVQSPKPAEQPKPTTTQPKPATATTPKPAATQPKPATGNSNSAARTNVTPPKPKPAKSNNATTPRAVMPRRTN